MKLFKAKTNYIDRLIPTQLSEQKPIDRVSRLLENKFSPSPIFEKSLFVKDLNRRVSLLRIAPGKFKTFKALFASLGFALGLLIVISSANFQVTALFFTLLTVTFIGFSLPDLYILDKENYRDYKIYSELPNLLDLLDLYAASAAYESFGGALFEISQTMHGVLAEELRDLTSMYRFLSLNEFLDVLEKRFSEQTVKELTTTVRLTEKYGGKFAKKISILAQEAHKSRLQKAKQLGQKSSVALLVPLLLFHFPVSMIIFMAPMVLSLKVVFG